MYDAYFLRFRGADAGALVGLQRSDVASVLFLLYIALTVAAADEGTAATERFRTLDCAVFDFTLMMRESSGQAAGGTPLASKPTSYPSSPPDPNDSVVPYAESSSLPVATTPLNQSLASPP